MTRNYYIFRRWNMDIIHSADGYRAIISTDNTADINIDFSKTWQEFAAEVKYITGISLPIRKHISFYKLSDFEQYAGIDASHCRPQGCIVSAKERRQGWRRESIT